MADEALIRSLSNHLFSDPQANVFALLDGASIDGLIDRLWGDLPEFECLYRGALEPDMAEVAPYLARLEPEADFTRWVLEKGWGNHWGIFAVSQADLRTLRRHLRTFTMVHDPDGKLLYFRYYDPRVLRVYLPTCNDQELKTVFGPIRYFLLEDEDPDVLLRFSRIEGGARREALRLVEAESPGT